MPVKYNIPARYQAVSAPSGIAPACPVATTPTASSRIERVFLTISLKHMPLPLANKGDL